MKILKIVLKTWWDVYFLSQAAIKLINAEYWYLVYCIGKIDNHYTEDKWLKFSSMHAFVFPVYLCMHHIKTTSIVL